MRPAIDISRGIGIVAGSGRFPEAAILAAKKHGQKVFMCAHVGETDPEILKLVDDSIWVRVGQLGKIIRFLKRCNVTQLIFTGAISRIRLFSSVFPDWRGLKVIRRAGSIRDDILLREISAECEREGIFVYSSAELLSDFLVTSGIYTNRGLNEQERTDAILGWEAAKTLGSLDVGQTAVATGGLITALECVEGTDATISRAGLLTGTRRSVVVKVPKPQQDKRLDLPALGIETIKVMIRARASALVLEAGGAMMLDPNAVIHAANQADISVVAVQSLAELKSR